MSSLEKFGDPARFEIAVGWVEDSEPREQRPAHGGWSTGALRITVGHHVLTAHRRGEDNCDALGWYLLPVFEWLAKNWISLLHEERFSWRENSAAPAATAAFLALQRYIDAEDEFGKITYGEVQGWWQRHALRAADSSALFPDVIFRRLGDDIEVSWTARQPLHAPDGFRFVLTPGVATLSVTDVATPLWNALNWMVASAPTSKRVDAKSVNSLKRTISDLAQLNTTDLEKWYLPTNLFSKVLAAKARAQIGDTSTRLPSLPAITHLDSAVLMFGGVNPDIGQQDVKSLLELLTSKIGGGTNEALALLVDRNIGAPLASPFEEGYQLAQELREELSTGSDGSFVDVRNLLAKLDIEIVERALKTSTIRGVAIAGEGYAPTILVNTTSQYNLEESGKRFTLAHELFHILYDQTRARRISHISGPWTSPGVEKRANAFAAMFLMPRDLILRSFSNGEIALDTIESAAEEMRVSASSLVEHLYNLSLINDLDRELLRAKYSGIH